MDAVLVLNADLGPLHRVTLRPRDIDHVLPSSRGGRNTWFNTWLNTVAACGGRNQRKGDRTPAGAGMRLRFAPTAPSWYAVATR